LHVGRLIRSAALKINNVVNHIAGARPHKR
jgi:hypothetical protein